MKLNFPTVLASAGVCLFTSCYPLPDDPRQQRPKPGQPGEPTLTSEEQQKIQEQRDRMKEEAARIEQPQAQQPPATPNTPAPPQEPARRTDYPFATPIPGKAGFVFSPYNNKMVDVRDIPSGTLVQDPTYPPAEKKYFRVP